MLKTQNLNFKYDKDNQFSFPDIDCEAGKALLIIGESGKGKTTLLHLLAGLLKVKKGDVWVGDALISKFKTADLDRFRGQHIGIIFQQSHFIKSLSVKENLLLAQHLAAVPQSVDRIKDLLSRLNISAKLNSKTQELSQGEQQRVAIARALLNQPKLILADEPTASLDDKNCQQVIQLLKEQAAQEKATLIIVTHDLCLKENFEKQLFLN